MIKTDNHECGNCGLLVRPLPRPSLRHAMMCYCPNCGQFFIYDWGTWMRTTTPPKWAKDASLKNEWVIG